MFWLKKKIAGNPPPPPPQKKTKKKQGSYGHLENIDYGYSTLHKLYFSHHLQNIATAKYFVIWGY